MDKKVAAFGSLLRRFSHHPKDTPNLFFRLQSAADAIGVSRSWLSRKKHLLPAYPISLALLERIKREEYRKEPKYLNRRLMKHVLNWRTHVLKTDAEFARCYRIASARKVGDIWRAALERYEEFRIINPKLPPTKEEAISIWKASRRRAALRRLVHWSRLRKGKHAICKVDKVRNDLDGKAQMQTWPQLPRAS